MQSEVNDPSPELVQALKTRTQLLAGIKEGKVRFKSSIGAHRRHIDREIEGLEKRLRKTVSLIESMLEAEGFPLDYELPEEDNDETSLVPA